MIKKLLIGFAVVALALGVGAVANAQTLTAEEQLQAQINTLLAQIAALSGGAPAPVGATTYTRDLTIGATGADVTALQNFLIGKGMSIPAGATGYFGSQTQAALAAYQASVGISPAAGYFGPITRARMNSMVVVPPPGGGTLPPGCAPGALFSATTGMSCTGGTTPDTPPAGLTGGAGSVSQYTLISGLNNEDVGEDEEDVPVAGMKVEADEGSDLEITAVRVVFDEYDSGTTSDFDNYAAEVSIWLDDEEFGRVDADGFNDDNNWSKTISLDDGAIIRAGDAGELEVRVTGISNLDTNDAGDDWDVDFTSVRYVDARGDSTSEDPGVNVTRFYFQSFATATNAELKIAEDNDDVNTAHVIGVDASADTDNEELLSFTLEAKGDSDLELRKLIASTTVTGATNVDGMISNITLWIDGDEVQSGEEYDDLADDGGGIGSSVGLSEKYLFSDLDYTIPAGDKVEVVIKADIYPTSGSGDLDEGDTIKVEITSSDYSLWDVRDESGTKITAADITGSATGEANAVYAAAIQAKFVSASAKNNGESGATTATDDTATYEIVFDVTAFGSDVYIDGDVVATTTDATITGGAANDGLAWGTTTNSANSATYTGVATTTPLLALLEADDDHTSDVDTSGSLSFFVQENDTRRFTLRVQLKAEVDAQIGTRIKGIAWDTDSADVHDEMYVFNLGGFKTSTIFLNNLP